MSHIDLIPDQIQFPLDQFAEDSYPITNGLPRIRKKIRGGNGFAATSHLNFMIDLLSVSHLGLPVHFDVREILELCVDCARDYFAGTWREGRPDLAGMIEKSPENKELEWVTPMKYGLLASLFAKDDQALKELADWLEPWLKPHPTDRVDPLIAKLYLIIGSHFRSEPLLEIGELADAIGKSRKKHIKAYWNAWLAAEQQDQAAFATAITEAVVQWERVHDGQPSSPLYCIATEPSFILAVGRKLGLELPELEPPISARLMTPESIRVFWQHLAARKSQVGPLGLKE